jgi:hypothetical protein
MSAGPHTPCTLVLTCFCIMHWAAWWVHDLLEQLFTADATASYRCVRPGVTVSPGAGSDSSAANALLRVLRQVSSAIVPVGRCRNKC